MSHSPTLDNICQDRDHLEVVIIVDNIEIRLLSTTNGPPTRSQVFQIFTGSWLGIIHPSRVLGVNPSNMRVFRVEHLYHIRSFFLRV
jgi:hypothetical protein